MKPAKPVDHLFAAMQVFHLLDTLASSEHRGDIRRLTRRVEQALTKRASKRATVEIFRDAEASLVLLQHLMRFEALALEGNIADDAKAAARHQKRQRRQR